MVIVSFLSLDLFLLTPLREGRRARGLCCKVGKGDFYSRPCGRGDQGRMFKIELKVPDFYSRPCGRGDDVHCNHLFQVGAFLLTPLREGRP